MRRTRPRPCAGCGRLLTGSQSASCVFGCGAYYCRRGRQQCADQHAKTCPAVQDLRTPTSEQETTMTATIDRAHAVKRIADHLADRTSWVVTAPPDMLAPLAEALGTIPGWTAYLDGGLPLVLRTDQADVLLAADALVATAAVLTVPKTVDASTLGAALSHPMPSDDAQDVLILRADNGPIYWPLLFVDAVDIVDPQCAAELRANHLPNLN